VRIAARNAKFLSSRQRADQSIAAIATQSIARHSEADTEPLAHEDARVFFFFISFHVLFSS
jgi:hypothetical protein